MRLPSQDKRKDGYRIFLLDKGHKAFNWQVISIISIKYISIKAILFYLKLDELKVIYI